MRNLFLTSLGVWCAFGIAASLGAEKPNFIVILTDDLGYNDFGCYGAKDLATPQLDQMAREGMRLTSFYVSPVCSPTRASLMTGCYARRVGVGGVLFERNPGGLNHDEKTLPELLKGLGYATALIGKWHLGYRNGQHPPHHGFDTWYGTIASNNTKFTTANKTFAEGCIFREGLSRDSVIANETVACSLMRNDEVIEVPADQSLFTRRYTEETIRFISENKDKPFLIYLAHNMPHIPLYASEAFRGKSERGLYGDVIEELDWGIGEVLRALRERGLDEKTLVLVTSDNGPKISAGGSAFPLRGGKGSSFEGGVRVPCIVRWPGRIAPGRESDEPVAIMDVLPTLVGLAGGEGPGDRIIDGKDIWPLLSGAEGAKSPHEAYYYLKGAGPKGVRMGEWKYLVEALPEDEKPEAVVELSDAERKLPRRERKELIRLRLQESAVKRGPVPALYNLRLDIGEQENVIEKYPDVAERLRTAMEAFGEEIRRNARPVGIAP